MSKQGPKDRFSDRPLTVSELNLMAREALEGIMPKALVTGEISNFKSYPSGHWYFSLKDDRCQLSCVMFRGSNQRLTFTPEDGMNVVAGGKATIYEVRGSFQLNVTTMEAAGTGALRIAFDKLKEKLKREGLFDPERKRPVPDLPRAIGVVTSPSGAAIKDILRVFDVRGIGLPVRIFGTRVQGEGAAAEIAEAINEMNRLGEVDVLIVGRGGGSIEDLWAFNEEAVARAIAASKIAVISAVGHEIDYTISDMVADERCPTPTAAASFICDRVDGLRLGVERLRTRLSDSLSAMIGLARVRLEATKPERLVKAWQRYYQLCSRQLDEKYDVLLTGMNGLLKDKKSVLANLRAGFDALNPEGVLKRGYSITMRKSDGKLLTDAGETAAGDKIEIKLYKGKLDAEVEGSREK